MPQIEWTEQSTYDSSIDATSYRVLVDGKQIAVKVSTEALQDEGGRSSRIEQAAEDKITEAYEAGTLGSTILIRRSDLK